MFVSIFRLRSCARISLGFEIRNGCQCHMRSAVFKIVWNEFRICVWQVLVLMVITSRKWHCQLSLVSWINGVFPHFSLQEGIMTTLRTIDSVAIWQKLQRFNCWHCFVIFSHNEGAIGDKGGVMFRLCLGIFCEWCRCPTIWRVKMSGR